MIDTNGIGTPTLENLMRNMQVCFIVHTSVLFLNIEISDWIRIFQCIFADGSDYYLSGILIWLKTKSTFRIFNLYCYKYLPSTSSVLQVVHKHIVQYSNIDKFNAKNKKLKNIIKSMYLPII